MVFAMRREDSGWLEQIVDWSTVASHGMASVYTDRALKKFTKWLTGRRHLPEFDHAMIFTSYRLIHQTRSMAYMNAVCDQSSSVSIVADRGDFQCVKVATHELAHSLGANHDGDKQTKSCPPSGNYVMSPQPSHEKQVLKNAFYFSPCSIRDIKPTSSCVKSDPPVYYSYDLRRLPPGHLYTADMQCKLIFGKKSGFCTEVIVQDVMCGQLWCKDPQKPLACRTNSYLTALPGTECGVNKVCHLGECTLDPAKNAINSASPQIRIVPNRPRQMDLPSFRLKGPGAGRKAVEKRVRQRSRHEGNPPIVPLVTFSNVRTLQSRPKSQILPGTASGQPQRLHAASCPTVLLPELLEGQPELTSNNSSSASVNINLATASRHAKHTGVLFLNECTTGRKPPQRRSRVTPVLGQRRSRVTPVLGQRRSRVTPVLGQRRSRVTPVLGQRGSRVPPVLGQRRSQVTPVLGQRRSQVTPVLGQRRSRVTPVLGQRRSRVTPVLGQRRSRVTPVLGGYTSGSVYCNNQNCSFKSDFLDWEKADAVITFNDSLLLTGWGILDIAAGYGDKLQTDIQIMFAAGFAEGILTAEHMESQFTNLFDWFSPEHDEKLKQKLDKWFIKQRQWANNMIINNPTDPLWRHASYIFAQLDGLYAGYKSVRGNNKDSLDMFAINFLNANGDLLDLRHVLNPSSLKDWRKFSAWEAKHYFYLSGHCSALIKVLPGFENIFMSHSSWFDYAATNRIFKHYNFNVADSSTSAKKVSFSSYPGYLESLDDFYLLGSGMVMLQTTNNIYNYSLYQYVSPQSLLAWQRVRIANMLANNGEKWSNIVSQYNSGTYNNQYMIIDLKLVKPGQPLPDNTFWVAEQIPRLVVAEDLTSLLRLGYFASYNVPYFEEIFNISGYQNFVKQHGIDYTYQLAPRAKIFRRDQSKVLDLNSMKKLMRSNDYRHDPYSENSPGDTICARFDLDKSPIGAGCYDTKVSDFYMAQKLQADILNGPTTESGLPAFSWTGKFSKVSHVGLPQTYNFSFISTKPSLRSN
ncbi:Phospholipase B-like 1 [Bulinus truncatus]|nr:Phospholipase B-like 1 [Bulinus truncatus]